MLTRGRLLPLLALTVVLAACGGSTATPTAGTAPAPPPTGADAVTISPFEADGDDSTAAAAEPVEAIFPEDAVPVKWEGFVKINYAYSEGTDAVSKLVEERVTAFPPEHL